MDKEQARQAHADYETQQMVLQSNWGTRLVEKLKEIDEGAVNKAMRGSTPESNNAYMESRGKVIAVKQVRDFFDEVDTEHIEANAILGSDVAESAPVDTDNTVDATTDGPIEPASEEKE